MKIRALVVVMLLSIAVFSGCAGRRIYLMEVSYLPDKKAAPTVKLAGICPFEDVRGTPEKDIIGIRHRHGNRVDLLKLEGTSLSEVVTQAVKDYFTDNGFQITDCKGWDESPEGLDRLPRDVTVVVGGKIHSFTIEAKSGVMHTTTQYTVKMSAHIGKVKERAVVTRAVESTPTDKKVCFDPDGVEGKLNGILTEALQKLLAECLVCD
jgi:hypothetical protein